MNLTSELLFWVQVWIVEFGIGSIIVIMIRTRDRPRPRRPLNRVSIGLLMVIIGTVVYLQANTGLFIIDNWVDSCKNMEDNTKDYLNCFSENQRNSKWTIFLYGFFATMVILFGNIMVSWNNLRNSQSENSA